MRKFIHGLVLALAMSFIAPTVWVEVAEAQPTEAETLAKRDKVKKKKVKKKKRKAKKKRSAKKAPPAPQPTDENAEDPGY